LFNTGTVTGNEVVTHFLHREKPPFHFYNIMIWRIPAKVQGHKRRNSLAKNGKAVLTSIRFLENLLEAFKDFQEILCVCSN
jgi:hypothetical protein